MLQQRHAYDINKTKQLKKWLEECSRIWITYHRVKDHFRLMAKLGFKCGVEENHSADLPKVKTASFYALQYVRSRNILELLIMF